jgi:hypothetical protein
MAGRKWGPAVSGLLIGLPLNSAPVALFIALERGATFARQTTAGIVFGIVSVVVFCLAYGWMALWRWPWPLAMALSWLADLLTTLALNHFQVSMLVALATAFIALLLLNWLLPRAPTLAQSSVSPWWDIPARMVVATGFLLALTAAAPLLGPQLSGLLATLPIYTAILAGFNHHLLGPDYALRFIRGLALGLFGFAMFFAVLYPLLGATALWLTFIVAIVVTLAFQAVLGWFTQMRAERKLHPAPPSPQPLS